MISKINALHRIAAELERVDPLVAYEFAANLRSLLAGDASYMLELSQRSKLLSHPADRLEITKSADGWNTTHTNVDGNGTRETTGWRLQPADVLKVIENEVEPGPMTDEVKAALEQEIAGGDVTGIPRGDEMGGGPTALPPATPAESSGIVDPAEGTWSAQQFMNPESIWDVATTKTIKRAIAAAKANPSLRPRLAPFFKKILSAKR